MQIKTIQRYETRKESEEERDEYEKQGCLLTYKTSFFLSFGSL